MTKFKPRMVIAWDDNGESEAVVDQAKDDDSMDWCGVERQR